MTETDKISREEMIEMFGTHMPIQAVSLLWDSDDTKTIGDIRKELRQMANNLNNETIS